MKKINIASSGFTLIEFLLYMGILSIFLIILTQTFTSILDVQLESEATSTLTQDGNFILSRFAYDINRAKTILIPANPGDQGSTLQLSIDGINYTYTLDSLNKNIMLTSNLGQFQLNSFDTSITGLNFERFGNPTPPVSNTITISFTLASKTIRNTGPEKRTYQTTVGIRQKP